MSAPRLGRLALALALSGAAVAAAVPVEEVTLENGMRLLLVRRAGQPMTAAAWAAHAGSARDTPGKTGMSHLVEHLLFQGSRTIGTRDRRREAVLMEREERLREELRQLAAGQAPAAAGQRRGRLEAELGRLEAELRSLRVKGEYARLYTRAGAVGINALTRQDLSLQWALVPANKLELWFWMESDRLLAPVFRELYAELDVIDEERRRRLDARPGALERARFAELFWGPGHPYAWPAIGRPGDPRRITRRDAEAWFSAHYGAAGLVAALVGDFDAQRVRRLAQRYFGRLPRRASPPADAGGATAPAEPRAEVRFVASCRCPTQVEIRHLTVPFGHADAAALDVLAGLLSGRSGRLHRALVLDRQIAFSASAQHAPLELAGSLDLVAEARGEATAAELEQACLAELERLRQEPVAPRELQKVKNQVTAEAWRQLRDPMALALRLLAYATLGDWRHLERWPAQVAAVTATDVQRVARTYLTAERRGVALISRADDGSAAQPAEAPPGGPR